MAVIKLLCASAGAWIGTPNLLMTVIIIIRRQVVQSGRKGAEVG